MRKYEVAIHEDGSMNGLWMLKVKGGQPCGPI